MLKRILQSCFNILFVNDSYNFAFIIHPRDRKDIQKKVKIIKYLPDFLVNLFEVHFYPVSIGYIKSKKLHINGLIISIPMTAKNILKNRHHAVLQARKALDLAKRYKIKYASLGALIAPVCAKELKKDKDINITDGRAYTGIVVYNSALKTIGDPDGKRIAIVGASLDVGKIVAVMFMRHSPKELILIDDEAKLDKLRKLKTILSDIKNIKISITNHIPHNVIPDVYITLSAKDSLKIRKQNITKNTIIINDAQPWGFDKSLIGMCNIYQGGVVRNDNVKIKGIDLKQEGLMYSCIAEGVLLSIYKDDFPKLESFDNIYNVLLNLRKITKMADDTGFVINPLIMK